MSNGKSVIYGYIRMFYGVCGKVTLTVMMTHIFNTDSPET